MNKVLLIGRMTRDPELRSLASGKSVTTLLVAANRAADGAWRDPIPLGRTMNVGGRL
jgi:single-stranded DNA-binding protein